MGACGCHEAEGCEPPKRPVHPPLLGGCHKSAIITFAAFVCLQWPRASVPAFVFAALVAWSRCFLGVHYPSDILAGALLGSSIGLGFARAASRAPLLQTFQLKLLELKQFGLKLLGIKGS